MLNARKQMKSPSAEPPVKKTHGKPAATQGGGFAIAVKRRALGEPLLNCETSVVYFIKSPLPAIDTGNTTSPAIVAKVEERIDKSSHVAIPGYRGVFSVPIKTLIDAGFGDLLVRPLHSDITHSPSEKAFELSKIFDPKTQAVTPNAKRAAHVARKDGIFGAPLITGLGPSGGL
jgi:hypothetical protein